MSTASGSNASLCFYEAPVPSSMRLVLTACIGERSTSIA